MADMRIWAHELCMETTKFAVGVNPNNPYRTCQNCLTPVGAWF